ncbi:MAG: hypothetical protein OK457_08555 [Thaumarchaeota archaeon]|nr:hypothetical protein [Nitrososphaerota archaeon]
MSNSSPATISYQELASALFKRISMSLQPGILGVEQIIEGKAPGMEGKYYEELSEEEKVRLNKYHDLLVFLKSQADAERGMSYPEIVEFKQQMAELHYVSLAVFSKLGDEERKKQMNETEEITKETEKVFGKSYVDSLRNWAGFDHFKKLPPFDALTDLGYGYLVHNRNDALSFD